MSQTATLAPISLPLQVADRCDRCGAQALIKAEMPNGGDVLMCRHHGHEHEAALINQGAALYDNAGFAVVGSIARSVSV